MAAGNLSEANFSGAAMRRNRVRSRTRIWWAAGVLLCAYTAARANDFWKRKPSTEWTLSQALKLVQRSPWAHEEVLPVTILQEDAAFSKPIGNKGCDPDAIDANGNCLQKRINLPVDPQRQMDAKPELTPSWAVLVRWESAAPIRQAFARLTALDAKAAAEYQSPPDRMPADSYVVTVKLAGSSRPIADPFVARPDGKPDWRATLKTKRSLVPATDTEYSGTGAAAAIHFFFPRIFDGAPLIGPGREQVEFVLQGSKFKIKTKFTLDPELLE